MSNLAIITARGGSKRIPRKNIKEFCGEPIIAYSIKAAIESGIFDEVMVSTDDDEIARIAISFGAKIPFMRSANTSNDYATTADVLVEVLEKYNNMGETFDYFCCIYPTAPFVSAEKIKYAMESLVGNNADSLIPVVKFSFPPQRAFIIDKDKLRYKWTENMTKRSQDLEPFYHDCGQFYCMKSDVFLKEKKLVTNDTISLQIPELEAQDIDTEEDWEIAEMKFRILKGKV